MSPVGSNPCLAPVACTFATSQPCKGERSSGLPSQLPCGVKARLMTVSDS
jgi:hypothetical protein